MRAVEERLRMERALHSSNPLGSLKAILDLALKRISEEEFLERMGTAKEGMPATALEMLEHALAEKDPDGIEGGMLLAWRFGFDARFLEVLNALALQPWHKRHEDVVFALGKLKDPSSVAVLAKTAVAEHPYLADDEAFALGTKSIYALKNIQNLDAVRRLGELSRHENEVLRKAAIGRLKDILKNGSPESAKAAAHELGG